MSPQANNYKNKKRFLETAILKALNSHPKADRRAQREFSPPNYNWNGKKKKNCYFVVTGAGVMLNSQDWLQKQGEGTAWFLAKDAADQNSRQESMLEI